MALSPPATWITKLVELQTKDLLTIGDARGTIWRGSAVIARRNTATNKLISLLPGRFSWEISPKILIGKLEARIFNDKMLRNPLYITGYWNNYQLNKSDMTLPSNKLVSLGAPFNTIRPSGDLLLSWSDVIFIFDNSIMKIYGKMTLDLKNIETKLSPVNPLGNYTLNFDWNGSEGEVVLSTKNGILILNGEGLIKNGKLSFSGYAKTNNEQKSLRNLMNLLGQWKTVNGEDVVSLRF